VDAYRHDCLPARRTRRWWRAASSLGFTGGDCGDRRRRLCWLAGSLRLAVALPGPPPGPECWPFGCRSPWSGATAGSIVHSGDGLRQGRWWGRRKISAPHMRQARRAVLLLVLLYRCLIDCLGLYWVVPFCIQGRLLRRKLIGTVAGGWGIARTWPDGVGGACCLRALA